MTAPATNNQKKTPAENPTPVLLVTCKEAGRLLGMSYSATRTKIREGHLDVVRRGGVMRVTMDSIKRFASVQD